jgi:hypothetical protein
LLHSLNSVAKRYLNFLEKREILAFKKIKVKEKVREREDELQENEEIEDFSPQSIVPSWLIPVLEGANIDIEKASLGDKAEIEKLAYMLLKFVGKGENSQSEGLILQ